MVPITSETSLKDAVKVQIVSTSISLAIMTWNQFDFAMARRHKMKPNPLPRLVRVLEVTQFEMEEFVNPGETEKAYKNTFEAKARYRVYYSRRFPGERKPSHRFSLGRIREGTIRLQTFMSNEGTDYMIEFPELKLKVET